ncbi:XIAP-associated factor 1-like [Chelmon rostratus]|uniref:XIAP-associated factor 1-like n=1 Tax=Chelmon rostratus TaxID=109905 RepID=UPI001BE6F05B|nr:XIAP-associated factor 1-like [Chelmon rostratus]
MDKKEATRTCGQCHRDVEVGNFTLHETHCSRFLCLCPDCEEAVPRQQLQQHREEQHAQVRCLKCNQKMERCQLMDHESDECVERLQSCQFCELELPWKELNEHRLACGSRTELCGDCGRYVTLRDRPEHGLTCSATDGGSGPPPATGKIPANSKKVTVLCSRCAAPFPAEDIEEHELRCVPATRSDDEEDEPEEEEEEEECDFSMRGVSRLSSTCKANSLSHRPSSGPWGEGGDPYQISTCPHCHLALPLLTLRWHEVKCQIYVLLK